MQISEILQQLKNKFPYIQIDEQPNALVVPKAMVLDVAIYLKNELGFENCHCVTAVDRKDKLELVYCLYSTQNHIMLILKTLLPMDDLTVHTVSVLWRSADWLEREVYDLFGIKFINHPDLRRILNPDNWTVFPLRKDFKRDDFIPRPVSKGLKG